MAGKLCDWRLTGYLSRGSYERANGSEWLPEGDIAMSNNRWHLEPCTQCGKFYYYYYYARTELEPLQKEGDEVLCEDCGTFKAAYERGERGAKQASAEYSGPCAFAHTHVRVADSTWRGLLDDAPCDFAATGEGRGLWQLLLQLHDRDSIPRYLAVTPCEALALVGQLAVELRYTSDRLRAVLISLVKDLDSEHEYDGHLDAEYAEMRETALDAFGDRCPELGRYWCPECHQFAAQAEGASMCASCAYDREVDSGAA